MNGGTDADVKSRMRRKERKRKRKTLMPPLKRVFTSVNSTEAETEGTEDFLFLPSTFLLPSLTSP